MGLTIDRDVMKDINDRRMERMFAAEDGWEEAPARRRRGRCR